MSIVNVVENLVRPVIEDLELVLWDVEFKKEGADYYLRIYIDKDGGINISDCEDVARKVNVILDDADPIEQSYILEISSAGLIRELKKDFHFDKYIGYDVQIKLFKAFNGAKKIDGTLVSYDEANINVKIGEDVIKFLRRDVSKITIDLV